MKIKDTIVGFSAAVRSGAIPVESAEALAKEAKTTQMRVMRRGRERLKQLSQELRSKAIQQSVEKSGAVCLLCHPEVNPSEDELRAHLLALSSLYPRFERYFEDILSEVDELSIADRVVSAKKRILLAIDTGIRDVQFLRKKTKLPKHVIEITLANLLEYGELEIVKEVAKTQVARGELKTLYRRAAKKDPNTRQNCVDCDKKVGPGYIKKEDYFICKRCHSNEIRLSKRQTLDDRFAELTGNKPSERVTCRLKH